MTRNEINTITATVTWFDISDQNRDEWETLCPSNEYRILTAGELPRILPSDLTNKFDSVFVMASGSAATGSVYYMANGNRVDFKDNAIDQQPFGLAFVGPEPIPSGCLAHHPDYEGRTTPIPSGFLDRVTASGVGLRLPLSELPDKESGSIDEIEIQSQKSAFRILVDRLTPYVEGMNDSLGCCD